MGLVVWGEFIGGVVDLQVVGFVGCCDRLCICLVVWCWLECFADVLYLWTVWVLWSGLLWMCVACGGVGLVGCYY